LIEPFMPETPAKIRAQLGIADRHELTAWESAAQWGVYPDGTAVQKGEALFPRIDAKKELEELERIHQEAKAAATQTGAPAKEAGGSAAPAAGEDNANLITIDDFAKVQMKVAEVIAAEKVPDSDKLLKLRLNVGAETRQVVSGIAKQYSPEEMVGKKVILITNLQPAVLRGVESQGMILAATKGKKLVLVTVDGDIPAGAAIS
jgi:methionyl-tRNA synthetase